MRFFKNYRIMNIVFKIFFLIYIVCARCEEENPSLLLSNLFSEISNVLNAEALPEGGRQHYSYRPQNNGISLGVYEALKSIARNDELECVSRLLCEAAAGGTPGSSGKQIKFDKLSLTNLLSYLKLDYGSSSPLLIFGRAALLGVSNRGDPYSCIINYPKCPKDQSRLLYYLNNHRGGFFQYFDNKYHKPGDYYYESQKRPGYYYQNKFNQISFGNSNEGLYEKIKKKANSDIYAQTYNHFPLSFPREESSKHKPMVFPSERSYPSGVDPRILNKLIRRPAADNDFVFSSVNRFPKQLENFTFFPQKDKPSGDSVVFITDRLPNGFYFPENEKGSYSSYPNRYSPNSFFPQS